MQLIPKRKNTLLKRNLKENSESENGIVIDDRMVRLIGVPFFGLVIPSATGLIVLSRLSPFQIFAYYLYFVFIAWVVWEGNLYLRDRFLRIIGEYESSLRKYVLMIAMNVFYTAPVSLGLLFGWKWTCKIDYVANSNLFIASAVIIVSVIFITNVYDKLYTTKKDQLQKVKYEQLEKAKVQAELEALKNQIDPHFMFNALNSLGYLIEDNPQKAQQYAENLAEVYRYILRSKDKDLVLLHEEIAFMQLYTSLLELRYEDAFQVHLSIDDSAKNTYLLPPVSMMVALENAVKHNEVSSSRNLIVDIQLQENQLQIKNKLQERKTYKESTKTGLKNLDERCQKLLGKGIGIGQTEGYFVLDIPLLKLQKA